MRNFSESILLDTPFAQMDFRWNGNHKMCHFCALRPNKMVTMKCILNFAVSVDDVFIGHSFNFLSLIWVNKNRGFMLFGHYI